MKIIKFLFITSLVLVLAGSCNNGLDPIEPVVPHSDQEPPTIQINYPIAGKPIVSPDSVATVIFNVLAVDDVELQSVTLELDGSQIYYKTSFLDYRRLDLNLSYDNITDGNHTLVATVYDKTDKSATTSLIFTKITAPPYTPMDGEVLYFPLDGYYLDLITGDAFNVVGSPGFATGKINDGYAGATDSYLTFPNDLLLGTEFSVAFWYKINAVPDRAGIIAISPPTDATTMDRTSGFRLFRENNSGKQNIGLNIGIGSTDVWMNPFITVPNDNDWMHIAISISVSHTSIYVNGASVLEKDLTAGISWANCTQITVASGQPNFIYWLHFSDLSIYDEIHFFNKAITAEQVQSLYSRK